MLPVAGFYAYKTGPQQGQLTSFCRECWRAHTKQYETPEKSREKRRRARTANPERERAIVRESYGRRRAALKDSYLAQLLRGSGRAVTPAAITAKRAQILAQRRGGKRPK